MAKLPRFKMYGLKTVETDGKSYGGFKWPLTIGAVVTAPDWDPADQCGGGLHFLPWGCGDVDLCDLNRCATWLVIGTDGPVVDITENNGGKSKCKSATVVFVGCRDAALAEIHNLGADDKPYIFKVATAGDRGTAIAGARGTATTGDRGTATAGYMGTAIAGNEGVATTGDRGIATAGYMGTAIAGNEGVATAGYMSTATAGDRGTATAGDRGTATAGDRGTATAGDRGTATAGDRGTATAGDRGTATAGNEGVATAGYMGIATAGDRGVISIRYYINARCRLAIGYVGEDGIRANKPYKVVNDKLVEA